MFLLSRVSTMWVEEIWLSCAVGVWVPCLVLSYLVLGLSLEVYAVYDKKNPQQSPRHLKPWLQHQGPVQWASNFQQIIHGGIYWWSSSIVYSKDSPEHFVQQVSEPESSKGSWRMDDRWLSTKFLEILSLTSHTTFSPILDSQNVKVGKLWIEIFSGFETEETKRSSLKLPSQSAPV